MPIFNSPPGWPVPPAGWTPPNDWKPDPTWPAAPTGWQWWIEESQLEAEYAGLRQRLADLDGLDAAQLATEVGKQRAELASLEEQLTQSRAALVETQELAILQEAGIYGYLHPLDDAPAYKLRLDILRNEIKSLISDGRAVHATDKWEVNGSAAEGRTMVRDFSKLMLRAYNAEADSAVQSVRPHRLPAATDRLAKVRETIARLGKTMSIRISDQYHFARVQELKLTADYRGKQEEEKEEIRAERERQREETKAQREFEREKAKLLKEQAHYSSALAKLRDNGEDTTELEAKLAEIDDEIGSVEAREANIRAGYVYVISNIGAFGPDVVKIGMTRRLEPDDRIRELGDASVPFKFDTHALIFSDDAVGLETKLHNALEAKRVNQVNLRREFFYATPADVRVLLEDFAGKHLLEYHETAEALEWRASTQAE
ncbi:DUF4041 domain-containing protein [Flindersiella endophytica]